MMDENKNEEISQQEIIEIVDERKPQSSSSKYWAIAVVFIAAILTAGFIFYQTSKAFYNTINKAFRPTLYHTEITMNTIGKLQQESKLVVMTAEVTVEMERSSSKLLWDWYHLGTTTVEMKFLDNKVQYYISADSLNLDRIKWDDEKQELVLDLPDPVLDEDIVDVQSDPDKIMIKKDIGWARLESHSGKALENKIRSQVRSKVIEAGKHELLLEKAKANAKKIVKELFDKLKKEKDSEIFV